MKIEMDADDVRVLKAAWRKHTITRARERYDIELSPRDYYDMQDSIRYRQAMYLQKLRGGRTEWLVLCESHDRVLRVIFSEKHHRIITALPTPNVHPKILRKMYKEHMRGRQEAVTRWTEDRYKTL